MFVTYVSLKQPRVRVTLLSVSAASKDKGETSHAVKGHTESGVCLQNDDGSENVVRSNPSETNGHP